MFKLFLIIILLILLHKYKETFVSIYNYNKISFLNPTNTEYCIFTKTITPDGGKYSSKISSSKIINNSNQHIKLFTDDFTKQDCINLNVGSGRNRGQFECKDFITPKEASKFNLQFSKKTCYDLL